MFTFIIILVLLGLAGILIAYELMDKDDDDLSGRNDWNI